MHINVFYFARMGSKTEIVRQRIEESKIPYVRVAEKIGVPVRTLYWKFDHDKLNWDIILKIGKAIFHDFRKDFPELKKLMLEPVGPYNSKKTKEEYAMEMDELKDELLRAYRMINDLRAEIKKYADKLSSLGASLDE